MKFIEEEWEDPKPRPKVQKTPKNTIKKQLFPTPQFDLQVTIVGEKKYRYELLEAGENKGRTTYEFPPIDCNTTTKFVQEAVKTMNGKVESSDPNASITKEAIQTKIMNTLETIDKELLKYKSNKSKKEAQKQKQNAKKHHKELHDSYIELNNILKENNITLMDFMQYICTYLSAGEEKNIITGVLCHITTYFQLGTSLWFMPVGKSGSGKTEIEKGASKFLPKDATFEVGSMTLAAFMRSGEDDPYIYAGKIIRLGDFGGDTDFKTHEEFLDTVKELTTEGKTSRIQVGDAINEETREKELVTYELKGKCSASFTTVKSEDINPQYRNRGRLIIPKAPYSAVARYNRKNDGLYKKKVKNILDKYLTIIRNYIEYVKLEYTDILVYNPYKKNLQDWFKEDEHAKRNDGQIHDILSAITLLNYEFRDKTCATDDKGNSYEVVVSTLEDNLVLAELFNPSTGLTPVATGIFNILLDEYFFTESKNGEEYVHAKSGEEYSKTADKDASDYENTSGCKLSDLKTLFTTKEARRVVNSVDKNYKSSDFGSIMYSLQEAGCIEEVCRQKNNTRQLVYKLSHYSHLGDDEKSFKPELYEEYNSDDVPDVFGDMDYTLPENPFPEEIPVIFDKSRIKNITVNGVGVSKWY